MPLDPSISLQAGAGAAAPANPFDTFTKILQMRQMNNQNQLFQQEFAARQRLGQIAAGSTDSSGNFDSDTFMNNALRDPIAAPFAGPQLQALRAAQVSQLQMEQTKSGIKAGAWADLGSTLATWGAHPNADPEMLGDLLRGWKGKYPPSVVAEMGTAPADLARSLVATPDGSQLTPALRAQRAAQLGALYQNKEQYANSFGTQDLQPQANPATGINEPVAGVRAPPGYGGGFTGATPISQGLSPEKANELTPTTAGPPAPRASAGPIVTSGGAVSSASAAATAPAAGPANLEYQKDRMKDMAAYQQRVDQQVADGANIMKTIQEAQKAKDTINPGGGASFYAKAAQALQAAGASKDIVDKVANGSLAGSQEFNKLMVDSTMSRIRLALEGIGGSRINQMEFQHFTENNPNIDTDPDAIDKIFKFWGHLYDINKDEQKQLNAHIKAGGNLSEWPQKWQDVLQNKYGIGDDEATAATSGIAVQGSASLPSSAKSQLQEGHVTTFKNGQKWTLRNGQAEQVK